jgi:hypothetical protein
VQDGYPGPDDLDANLVGFGRRDFDVLDGQFSSGFPRNSRLPRISLRARAAKVSTLTLHVIVFPAVSDIVQILSRQWRNRRFDGGAGRHKISDDV